MLLLSWYLWVCAAVAVSAFVISGAVGRESGLPPRSVRVCYSAAVGVLWPLAAIAAVEMVIVAFAFKVGARRGDAVEDGCTLDEFSEEPAKTVVSRI
jgi:hypothetical protein